MNEFSFSSLTLNAALLKNLESLDYQVMTEIQAQSLPSILKGKDVIAQAKTGSGKTAAFGLGLLQHLNVKRFCVQSLVLCPTRELADQVAKEIRRLARNIQNIKVLTLCGGTPLGPQVGSLEHGVHIIVGTPGRVEEHLHKGTLTLDRMKILVLDEADRMLDMGFEPAIDAIVEYAPKSRQTLLFSATYPDQIRAIAKRIMAHPISVKATETHDSSTIEQHFYRVDDDASRLTALRLLLLHHRPDSTLVFCNTKRETQAVADQLYNLGFNALALHGDLEQRDREQALVQFTNKSVSILVATDVAARGLDIDTLSLVINYHLSRELEVHVHRVGRTGRAGNHGVACTLYNENERHRVDNLADYLDQPIEPSRLPQMGLLKQPSYKAANVTLQIGGGKKQKVRPGDILGALTGADGIKGNQVGKISVFDNRAYVAISRAVAEQALEKLTEGKLKGRTFWVKTIGEGSSWPAR